jgi:hypothetical protein
MLGRRDRTGFRSRIRLGIATLSSVAFLLAVVLPGAASAANGELDCNGQSPIEHSVKMSMACTDIRGFNNVWNKNTWNGRFYDNGEYIGHDEPDMTFLSPQRGSGNDVTWTETLPKDPTAAPTATNPGSDVTHWFELSVAPWFSMAMCDPKSYPQSPCTPESDSNAPAADGSGGGGSAFMEMQFYPPGFAPFADAISCDNTHWCSALTIDSLACTENFAKCNPNCEEPVNFAYIQQDGVPTGPAAPGSADLASFTPNAQTLLYNPGDKLQVHMFDAPIPGGGGKAFEVVIKDLSTGQSGFMQASATNGFANTSMADCSTTPFNFQPEYNTAGKANIVPWAALQTNISTQYETGHWEACTSVTGPGRYPLSATFTDTYYKVCNGPYESGTENTSEEPSDAFCYPQNDTHGGLTTNSPDTTTGCLDDLFQNGDLDFDGQPYYADWPTSTSTTPTLPSSFVQQLPTTSGASYQQYFIQTDLALSESTCSGTSTTGCTVPPPGPGDFYPYWSRVTSPQGCTLEFGNVSSGAGVNDFGQDAQYGSDQIATLGYPEFEGPVMKNTCGARGKS